MNTAMLAIIKKDFRGVAANKRLMTALLVVPLMFTLVLPSIFVFTIHFAPIDPDFQRLLTLLPMTARMGDLKLTLTELILNSILPPFFLIIPIMTASIMAASAFVGEKEKHELETFLLAGCLLPLNFNWPIIAFVGEKEKHTLETLLYCPLTVKQIFRAKVLASFLLSMMVSLVSFCAMALVLELETFLLAGCLLPLNFNWPIILLLVSPSISLIAVTLIVRGSAKARSVEESQQSAIFLIIPIVLLLAGQFTGVLLVNAWILLGLGALSALLAWVLLKKSMSRFTNEMLLSI